MMAKYINECPYMVPIERISEGNYMFGNRKAYGKIMNGKLIIRVGGGYMTIEEFLKQYESEFNQNKELHITVGNGADINIDPRGRATPPKSK